MRQTYFDDGFVEDGVEGGVEHFLYVLQQHGHTELDGALERAHVVVLLQVDHFQALHTAQT